MTQQVARTPGRRPSKRFMVGKAVREFFADDGWDRSAAMTFFAVLSVPPIAVALVSVLALVGQGEESTAAVLEILVQVAPDAEGVEALSAPVLAVLRQPSAGFTFVLGLATGLWMAAGYVGAFGRAMNVVYGVTEGRPLWRLQAWHLLTTVVLVAFSGLVTLLLVVSGPVAEAVGRVLGLGETTVTLWQVARWPLLLLAAAGVVAVLYFATPNVRHPRFRLVSHGSVLALALAGVASLLFRLYLSTFGRLDLTYGAALAGVVAFFLWLWIINMALLLGAEVDAEVQRARQLVSGLRAEQSVVVEVRDTRASDRSEARRLADEDRSRSLRRSHGWHDEEI